MKALAHPDTTPKERLQRGRDHLATITEHPPARDDLMETVKEMVKAAFEWGYEEGFEQAQQSVSDWHDPRPMGW